MKDVLLNAVLDAPEDDLPRLAYADFLEEHGDGEADRERAEFIQAQIALARPVDDNAPLRRRMEALWYLPARGFPSDRPGFHAWRFTLSDVRNGYDDLSAPIASVRRGFAEAVACSLASWTTHGPMLATLQPVTSVRLTDRNPSWVEISQLKSCGWFPCYNAHRPDEIPWAIAGFLKQCGCRTLLYNGMIWYVRNTEEQAALSLSQACLKFARMALLRVDVSEYVWHDSGFPMQKEGTISVLHVSSTEDSRLNREYLSRSLAKDGFCMQRDNSGRLIFPLRYWWDQPNRRFVVSQQP